MTDETSDAALATLPRPGSGEFFDAIAARYDLLNRVLSMGIDHSWRRRAVASLELHEGAKVLDLATGTADLAIAIAEAEPGAAVMGTDPSRGMLAIGEAKVAKRGLASRVSLAHGDARQVDAEDGTFDAITIAFGIRNVPDRLAALREMRRVGRPGARVAVLELGEPSGGLLGPLARFHVRVLVPRIGALLSGAREYRYLQSSIAAFPPAPEFIALMREAGLVGAAVQPLTFGACNLYTARVPGAEERR